MSGSYESSTPSSVFSVMRKYADGRNKDADGVKVVFSLPEGQITKCIKTKDWKLIVSLRENKECDIILLNNEKPYIGSNVSPVKKDDVITAFNLLYDGHHIHPIFSIPALTYLVEFDRIVSKTIMALHGIIIYPPDNEEELW